MIRRQPGGPVRIDRAAWRAVVRLARIVAFLGHYLRLLLRASLVVTVEIITPRVTLAPAIVEFRMLSRTPLEIAAIAHLVNLTPGTLVLEIRSQPPTMFVHGMHAADADDLRRELSDLEGRLLHALRPF